MTSTLHLSAGNYTLTLEPEEGGAVACFEWEGEHLFRPRCGPGPFNSACFPLVPFSNRIAFGKFNADGRVIELAPNCPDGDHPHTLHGFGWRRPWALKSLDAASATLSYLHQAAAWPWAFEAEQRFELSSFGLRHHISVRNLCETPMPAGLGVHPYFPCTPQTIFLGRHRGEWETSADGLPIALRLREDAVDWWQGKPVSTRAVDTVYVGREGPLSVAWPERNLRLVIAPSAELSFTTTYSPPGAGFFCVEPVSHETNALNCEGRSTGQRWLRPGEGLAAHVYYAASRLDAEHCKTAR